MFKKYWSIILLAVIIVGGSFYWYEWRPSYVRKDCYSQSNKDAKDAMKKKAELSAEYKEAAEGGFYSKNDAEVYYKQCLRSHGLED